VFAHNRVPHFTNSILHRYDKSFRLFWTNEDIALGPALLAIVADINYSKVNSIVLTVS
jgi:hypothetical protein